MTEKFIKCHGLLKDEIVDQLEQSVRIDYRFYAFIEKEKTSLVQWKDERTIVYIVEGTTVCIQFWDQGIKVRQYTSEKEISGQLFSICLEFYTTLEHCGKWVDFLEF